MRYMNLFIEYSVYMCVSIHICMCLVTIYEFWTLVTLYFIVGNIGKRFGSEIGVRTNDRSNLFPIPYTILIYNVWAASLSLVDKLEPSPCISFRRHL